MPDPKAARKGGAAAYEGLDYAAFKKKFVEDCCRLCSLSKGRNNVVFDRGNAKARILIIGEAPGAEEDKTGRPFVGRAGKMLDKILAGIGLDTERDALVANVVKCRPPDNRPPTPTEAETCRPFLDKQIALINPEIILLFGATAAKHFFPETKDFSSKTGTIETKNGRTFMFLYHPAYLLYDPRKRDVMAAHLGALKTYLAGKGGAGTERDNRR